MSLLTIHEHHEFRRESGDSSSTGGRSHELGLGELNYFPQTGHKATSCDKNK